MNNRFLFVIAVVALLGIVLLAGLERDIPAVLGDIADQIVSGLIGAGIALGAIATGKKRREDGE